MSRTSLVVASWLLPMTALAALAPTAERSRASAPPDTVWFTGSSNFNTFTCRTTEVVISAEAALEDVFRTRADGIPAVKSAALAIPVNSLDCGVEGLNRDLSRTLRSDAHPVITFRMGDYVIRDRGEQQAVRMEGALRIGGQERDIVVHGTVHRDESGQLRFSGERAINVRSFGIRPPRRYMGLMRVRDDITIHFDVAVRPLIDPLSLLSSSIR